ncbi:EpsG family protein [Flavobacterium davisii]|uniref:EpsG family protein n=1 Tax=Flavobacterium davisii TaxID=2906077 RepID=UPI0013FE0ED2|nr:EpsG family protein [Flavobacterium davisii]
MKSYFFYLLCCCIPAILIVVLRGDVGTDKGYYKSIIDQTINGDFDSVPYESGFKYLTLFLSQITRDVDVIIAIIGLLTSLFVILSFSKTKYSYLIFIFILFPYFFYDMTMNGLRYGLSFAIAALASQKLKDNKNVLFYIISFIAISIQYSSFLVIVLIYFNQFKFEKKHLFLIVIALILSFKLLDIDYFDNKVDAYSTLIRPTEISGLSPLFLFIVILLIHNSIAKFKSKYIYLLLVLQIISFFLSMKSYSGLRFQNLIIFTLLIFIVNFTEVPKVIPTKKIFALFFIGIICITLKLRNFMNEDVLVETPFLPYEFYWEK